MTALLPGSQRKNKTHMSSRIFFDHGSEPGLGLAIRPLAVFNANCSEQSAFPLTKTPIFDDLRKGFISNSFRLRTANRMFFSLFRKQREDNCLRKARFIAQFRPFALVFGLFLSLPSAARGAEMVLSKADYLDRVHAVWVGQIAAVLMTFPQEHNVASTLWLTNYPRVYTHAIVDDDWYYELVAIRAFEKHGIGLTVEELGEQWKLNSAGSWGSSEQARLALARGIKAPDTGHPRYNRLWFTIGPQFSADVYGAIAPGLLNIAG